MKKLFIIFIAVAGFGVSSFGQAVTGQATSTATIIAPISITKITDMNFGKLSNSTTSGTAVLGTTGLITSTTGGILEVTGGTLTAAEFEVRGSAGKTYTISLPTGAATLTKTGGAPMTADTWTSNPVAASGGILDATTGIQRLKIGATLNINANQAGGVYTSTAFDVIVNY